MKLALGALIIASSFLATDANFAPKAGNAAQSKKAKKAKKARKAKKAKKAKKKKRRKKRVARPSAELAPSERSRKPARVRKRKRKGKGKGKGPKFACAAALPDAAPNPARYTKLKKGMDAVVADRSWRWAPGSTLKIGFVDGSDAARRKVGEIATEWTKYANLEFKFFYGDPPASPDILIEFDYPRCDSAVGTSSSYLINTGGASMHLCNLDRPAALGSSSMRHTVLHEFGHAIGLQHEHQSPNAKFTWNKEYVYDYYRSLAGWSRHDTDFNVFRQLSAANVTASEYDRKSVMQYIFPAEFTQERVHFGGPPELSSIDKREIAKVYPGNKKAKQKTFKQRKVAVRNLTGEPINVRVLYESRVGGKWKWQPGTDIAKGASIGMGQGREMPVSGARGRRVRVLATNQGGGSKRWEQYADKPLEIAPSAGYRDLDIQTYVVTIEGAPDTGASASRDDIWDAGKAALKAGKYKLARKRFREYTRKFPGDKWEPWARFNVMLAFYEQANYYRSIRAGYDLIVAFPNAEASNLAWFYGGAANFELGDCADAKAYFDYVTNPSFGLPDDFQAAAAEFLKAMKNERKTYCN